MYRTVCANAGAVLLFPVLTVLVLVYLILAYVLAVVLAVLYVPRALAVSKLYWYPLLAQGFRQPLDRWVTSRLCLSSQRFCTGAALSSRIFGELSPGSGDSASVLGLRPHILSMYSGAC